MVARVIEAIAGVRCDASKKAMAIGTSAQPARSSVVTSMTRFGFVQRSTKTPAMGPKRNSATQPTIGIPQIRAAPAVGSFAIELGIQYPKPESKRASLNLAMVPPIQIIAKFLLMKKSLFLRISIRYTCNILSSAMRQKLAYNAILGISLAK